MFSFAFFFTDPATTEIYTLSLHDALPIWRPATCPPTSGSITAPPGASRPRWPPARPPDRKSTRLNSSHRTISYAVFCLKKKTEAIVHRFDESHIREDIGRTDASTGGPTSS